MSAVLLIGANGQLGSDLHKSVPAGIELVPVTHERLDILEFERVDALVADVRPDVVINTAAFVNVDQCEDDAALAFAVNSDAVRNLAVAADRVGACLVQISTDYVFDGLARTPYTEDAPANPLNVYGRSKLAGEQHARELCRRHLVVRSSGLYGLAGSSGKGGNFVNTMLRLGRERGEVSVVDDQVLAPTNTADLAQTLWRLIEGKAQGVYHATNAGQCSWFEFARAILETAGVEVRVKTIDSATFAARATRPAYSVLDNGRMRPWPEALADYLQALARLT